MLPTPAREYSSQIEDNGIRNPKILIVPSGLKDTRKQLKDGDRVQLLLEEVPTVFMNKISV